MSCIVCTSYNSCFQFMKNRPYTCRIIYPLFKSAFPSENKNIVITCEKKKHLTAFFNCMYKQLRR